jgi:hypothetical protein
MILIKRNIDGIIMYDKQSSDWNRQTQLDALYVQKDTLQPEDAGALDNIQNAINMLEAYKQVWYNRRIQAVIQNYGGVLSDYSIVQVPKEQEADVFRARYVTIEEDGTLTCDLRPLYSIDGSVLTITAGWITGNQRLIDDDVTDFSGMVLTETLFVKAVIAENEGTRLLTVQVLSRNEDEEFSVLPAGMTEVLEVCNFSVSIDNELNEVIL